MLIRAIERDDDLWVGFTLLGVIVLMVGASSISQQNGLFEAQVASIPLIYHAVEYRGTQSR